MTVVGSRQRIAKFTVAVGVDDTKELLGALDARITLGSSDTGTKQPDPKFFLLRHSKPRYPFGQRSHHMPRHSYDKLPRCTAGGPISSRCSGTFLGTGRYPGIYQVPSLLPRQGPNLGTSTPLCLNPPIRAVQLAWAACRIAALPYYSRTL